jgi:hypothetical protein
MGVIFGRRLGVKVESRLTIGTHHGSASDMCGVINAAIERPFQGIGWSNDLGTSGFCDSIHLFGHEF